MKSLLLSLLLLTSGNIVLAPSLLLAQQSNTKKIIVLTIDDANSVNSISHEVALDETLEIELKINSGTGCSWHFSSFSQEGVLHLESDVDGTLKKEQTSIEHFPNDKDKLPVYGAPQKYLWNFSPTSLERTTVNFDQKNPALHTINSAAFDIVVVPAKHTDAVKASSRTSSR
ncbi:MAG: protease inhibitor I42 family protein [Chthoniobacterales bacterium]